MRAKPNNPHWSSPMIRIIIVLAALGLAACSPGAPAPSEPPRAVIETALGDITVEMNPDAAPITVSNFIMHAEAGVYDGGAFYRAVRDDNERPDVEPMNLIQGGHGLAPLEGAAGIAHEPTTQTGLTHSRGAISMGRFEVGTAATEFFIMVNDYPGLDAGPGTRNPDEAGYAVFGRVVDGMEVVEAIWGQPTSLTNAPEDYQHPQYMDARIVIERIRIFD